MKRLCEEISISSALPAREKGIIVIVTVLLVGWLLDPFLYHVLNWRVLSVDNWWEWAIWGYASIQGSYVLWKLAWGRGAKEASH